MASAVLVELTGIGQTSVSLALSTTGSEEEEKEEEKEEDSRESPRQQKSEPRVARRVGLRREREIVQPRSARSKVPARESLLKLENEWGRRSQRVFGMGIRSGSESGSEESVGRGHRKTGCQSARTLNSAHA
ncbi:hypothetical protein HZH68_010235 [Vespula germanica]|uniref:Uncharacterized protein n=1 Tax=Vespula germanica TaxID=30212 RepID=A0A834JTQ0_VESGE|nr:hypothetical protein HZH68_010235 [Vespula germanica]